MIGEHRVANGKATIHAVVHGPEGAPWLTCLHALATDLHLWDSLLPVLSLNNRVLRIDLCGHGSSTIGSAPYTIEGLADDVVAVWNALRVDRSAVLGLSLGGMIGISLALSEPDRVSALIAADCRADAPPAFQAMFDARDKALADAGMAGVEALTLPSWISPETLAEQPRVVAALRAVIRGTRPKAYLAATAALRTLALKPRLAQVSAPSLFLVGALDGPHPAAMREMANAIPGAHFVEIPGAAHLAHLDRPDAFAKAVTQFLEEAR